VSGAERARAAVEGGPVIRLEHVSRVYPVGDSEVRALDDVSLEIARGEFVAVMGPSGSGKSTLLNVLGCLDTPSAGRYVLDGESVESFDGSISCWFSGPTISVTAAMMKNTRPMVNSTWSSSLAR
jgi:ABC-type nitrate/sulfonate/bicarbonate transport system ATPase subunit